MNDKEITVNDIFRYKTSPVIIEKALFFKILMLKYTKSYINNYTIFREAFFEFSDKYNNEIIRGKTHTTSVRFDKHVFLEIKEKAVRLNCAINNLLNFCVKSYLASKYTTNKIKGCSND